MPVNLKVGDANLLGDCYTKFGKFEAAIRRAPKPGEMTTVELPSGFYWRIEPPWMLIVYPGWWRKLLHAVTGRWSLP